MSEVALGIGCFDVAIIGAGVVGAAVARRLALAGARVAILEKAVDPLDGASKGNSAILHTGFDAPVGSLEQRCVARGREIFLEIQDSLGLPLHETGALVLAWDQEQEGRLDELISKSRKNGVTDTERLSRKEILALEPHISEQVIGGFRVPGEHIIDPWTTPIAYLTQALAHNAEFFSRSEVLAGNWDGATWSIKTARGTLSTRAIVNCSGLYGDQVEKRLIGEAGFVIRPRKGQFLVFDKAASNFVRSILLPVPNERTKGVVLCRTIFGNVLIGPTAEEQESRDDASVDSDTLEMLRAKAIEMVPAIDSCEITATYAGIRPASEHSEYQVNSKADMAYVNLGGIRSTGLSAALGLAEYLLESYGDVLAANSFLTAPVKHPQPVAPQHLSDYHERDWSKKGNGGVICHCEKVTHRDIETAFSEAVPPRSFAGLKRRTRVCMGRCQGFYCMSAVAALTRGRFDEPMTVDEPDLTDAE